MSQPARDAARSLETTGDIRPVLAGYQQMMAERDVARVDFIKNEETHRDLLCNTILENPYLKANVEYEVTKASSFTFSSTLPGLTSH